MLEKFMHGIYEDIVEDGLLVYKNMYESIQITEKTINYWKDAKKLFDSLGYEEKKVFFNILEQTMIDATARTFYLLDSGMKFDGEDFECDVIINGKSADHDLKDYFLERADELQNSK